MTGRDRLVVLVLVALGLVGAAWWFVVAPERQQAARADQQLVADNQARDGVYGQVAQAHAAVAGYATTKTALGAIDRAVPTTGDVSDLIRQLATTAGAKHVDFRVISLTPATAGSGSPAVAPTTAPAAATGTAGATPGSAPLTGAASSPALASAATINTLTFSFTFVGGYLDLERFLRAVNGYAAADSVGQLKASGRLLSVKSISLAPSGGAAGPSSGGGVTGPQASITAEAYVLAAPALAVPAAPNTVGAPVLGSAVPGRARIPGTVLPAPARHLVPLPGTPRAGTAHRLPAGVPGHVPEAALVGPAGQTIRPVPAANASRTVGGTR